MRQDATDGANSLENAAGSGMSMNAKKLLVWGMIVCPALFWPSQNAFGRARGVNEIPECVTVRNTTRPSGYGYDHIVYVRNGCRVTVECAVGARHSPKPEFSLVVPPGLEKGVVTGTHAKKRHSKTWVQCIRRSET